MASIVGARSIDIEQPVVHRARLEVPRRGEVLRPADDERDVQPLLVAELLAADVRLAVVAEEDDDRVVGQAVGLELLEDQADLAVELAWPRRDTAAQSSRVTGWSG